jgi:predicted Zn-dependent protease
MRRILPLAVTATVAITVFACVLNPETGRRQLLLYGEQEMAEMGAAAYPEALAEYPVVTGTADARMVDEISRRIIAVCGYDAVPPEAWEHKLLDAPDVVNAFALPGGKIAVYSGLLRVTQNADALAAVIGHEVAHVTLDHGNERVSQNVTAEVGLSAIQAVLGSWDSGDETLKAGIAAGLGIGAQYGVLLPFSRKHETEADLVGLRYLIRAGYDPYEAPKLWERMAELGGGGTFEWLSTHPSSERRAREMREAIPGLLAEEGRAPQPSGSGSGS